jgi:hypothetical protein
MRVPPVDGKRTSSGRLADSTRLHQSAWLQLGHLGGVIAAASNGFYVGGMMAGRQSSKQNQRSRNAGDGGNGGTPSNGGDASVTTTGQTIGTATGTLVGLPGTPGMPG